MTAALAAPDSFKGSLTAEQVADAMAAGMADADIGFEVRELPLADGGEGTAGVLLAALGGEWVEAPAHDPVGRPITATYARLADGRAAVDAAAASGLTLLSEHELDPLGASTRGTGELVAHALRAGASEVLVAAGGSATTDGGTGAVDALREAGLERASLTVICDASTPWERAAEVFSPQKGANPEQVASLARRLDRLAAEAPRDPRGVPSSGAAGGLAGGLWAWFDATLAAGAAFVCDQAGFDRALDGCSLCLTGEGRLDATTAEGKLVAEVARRAEAHGVPCYAVVGGCALGAADVAALDLRGVREAGDPNSIRAASRQLAEVVA